MWHHKIFNYMLYISYILFIVAFTGIYSVDPTYLKGLNMLIKIYVSLFLILRFNPYFEIKTNGDTREFDRTIAFSAGIFLLLTTSIIEIATAYIPNPSLYIASEYHI